MFRGIAAYLGLAIGDALGATVEFMTPAEIRHEYGVHQNMIGGGWLKLKAGDITDDTEMSLALGNAILSAGKVEPASVAEAFSQWMRGKPKDIGNTVRRGIVQYRRTGQTTMPESEHDAGNGACMRCLPVALVTLHQSWTDVQTASRLQAHTTHNNPVSDAGTECIIQMVQAAILGEPLAELELLARALVMRYPVFEYRQRRRDNPSGYIVDTLQAVFQALFSAPTILKPHWSMSSTGAAMPTPRAQSSAWSQVHCTGWTISPPAGWNGSTPTSAPNAPNKPAPFTNWHNKDTPHETFPQRRTLHHRDAVTGSHRPLHRPRQPQ